MNAKIADAIREVTASVQKETGSGKRSRVIYDDDLVEVLLAVADRIDPPFKTNVCPKCGEFDRDKLAWQDDGQICCGTCGTIY